MVIKKYYGDVLKAEADMICHQTNCLGIMGAGLAAQVKQQYPQVYEKYKLKCENCFTESFYNPKKSLLGQAQLISIDNGRYIANLFGQMGVDSGTVLTDYNALANAFLEALKKLYVIKEKPKKIIVAIPYLMGCGIAGGNWELVYGFIYKMALYFCETYHVDLTLKIVEYKDN